MNKLTITLKQHTPLIHFQHEQQGATLRASEVKPKLDRFIISKLKGGLLTAKEKCWIIEGQETALHYKMRFHIKETPDIFNNNELSKDRQGNIQKSVRRDDGREIKKLKPYPLFFANLNADIDDPSEYKRFSMLNEPFTMELFSFKEDLLEQINTEGLLAEFFQYHNFGTRQSKGFGSFYIDENDASYYKEITLKYRFSSDIVNTNRKWLELYETIDLFYKSLRSGINICWGQNFYMKPAIFQYAQKEGKDWDKKLIKQVFLNNKQPVSDNHYLFKDLLGLSTNENWMSYKTSITKENEKIKRYQSPILFKPILNEGYFDIFVDSAFDCKEQYDHFLGKQFAIKSKNNKTTLVTYPLFDIDEFLEFALLRNNIKELTEDHYHKDFLKLEDIYNEIKCEHEL